MQFQSSSFKSQQMYDKLGYRVLATIEHERYVDNNGKRPLSIGDESNMNK
jgi:hypothetical protein